MLYIMKYIILLSLTFSFIQYNHAQKQDYIWLMGVDGSPESGIQGMIWDWNTMDAGPQEEILPFNVDNNNASICDEDGNLLFWSNGCSVINRNQEVMPNGDTLNWDPIREIVSGWDTCDYGYPGAGNIKIISDPRNGNSDIEGFYLIHKTMVYVVIVLWSLILLTKTE